MTFHRIGDRSPPRRKKRGWGCGLLFGAEIKYELFFYLFIALLEIVGEGEERGCGHGYVLVCFF